MSQPKQHGYIVLVTVLVLGAVSTVVVGLLLLSGRNASVASSGVVADTNTKAAASACAQLALGAIQANPNLALPTTANLTVNTATGQTCTYTISGVSPNLTIAVTGNVTQGSRTYVHRMTVTINQILPQINVTSWQSIQ